MRTTIILLTMMGLLQAQTRPTVVLEGSSARAVMDLLGGSWVGFEFNSQKLNPLVWDNANPGMAAKAMSHFVCLDRWGQPSQAELKNGMPFHGEATKVKWNVDSSSKSEARTSAHLPMANFDIVRTAKIHPTQALLHVTESVTNRNQLGRPYNIVQHPTIGPPFLDASVVVDANARKGFMQSSPMPNPEEPSVFWPQALEDGHPVDLRRLTNDPEPNVVSYVVEDEYGWVTAANPSKGLLIGYLWKTSEYPWLNIWRHVDEQSKPLARGLEFGTTGLHQPFQILLKKGRIFNRPLSSWLEPGETHTRSYVAFLFKIPSTYQGVAQLVYKDGSITLTERGATPKKGELTMNGVRLE